MIAGGKILHGYGVGTITLTRDHMNTMESDDLITDSQPLGVDLFIGMDIMKMLGGVNINKFGKGILSRMNLCACTAIKIEELHFSAEFDEKTRVWTASSKWSGDQPPNELTNRVHAYPVRISA